MKSEELSDRLKKIFSNFKTKPILFFGSGMSRRYMNLPDWKSLLDHFAQITKPDNPYSYRLYSTSASEYLSKNSLPDEFLLPQIAQSIELDYNKLFYSTPSFESQIKENYPELMYEDLSPFKTAICDYLKTKKQETETLFKEVVGLAAIRNKFSNLITTNYDDFLEILFPNYSVLVGQTYIFNNQIKSIGNIFKIHGSVTKPGSLIITYDDYKKFNEKSKFLSAKLLTLFIEYPIIFLGYGINDVNIRNIFNDIKVCLNEQTIETLSKQMLFIEMAKSEEEQDIITTEITGLQMLKIRLYDYNLLYNSFDAILDTIDVHTLRILEDKIAQLVQSTDKSIERVYATSLENQELNADNLAVYIAHESSVFDLGYSSIRLLNLCEDVLFHNKGYDPNGIIAKTILSQKAIFHRSKIPIYKYLKDFNGDLDEFYKINSCIINKLDDIYNNQDKKTRLFKHPITQLSHIIGTDDSLHIKIYNIYLSLKSLDLDEVKEYLKSIWSRKGELQITTYLTKIVCVIDLKENKKEH